jgi:hypothetical protein
MSCGLLFVDSPSNFDPALPNSNIRGQVLYLRVGESCPRAERGAVITDRTSCTVIVLQSHSLAQLWLYVNTVRDPTQSRIN